MACYTLSKNVNINYFRQRVWFLLNFQMCQVFLADPVYEYMQSGARDVSANLLLAKYM